MSSFKRAGQDFVTRVQASFARQRMMTTLGATLCAGGVYSVEGSEETVVLTTLATMMTVRDRPGIWD